MKLFHPLLAIIASATESELARQVRYLKEENQILRDRIDVPSIRFRLEKLHYNATISNATIPSSRLRCCIESLHKFVVLSLRINPGDCVRYFDDSDHGSRFQRSQLFQFFEELQW
jgi:hypothetical protein